jgi:putative transposase
MPNHVHLIAVPQSADGLRLAIGEVHRRYTRMINFRQGWRGHFWQGLFASFVLDEASVDLERARCCVQRSTCATLTSGPDLVRISSMFHPWPNLTFQWHFSHSRL